jgi:hypothetical protein
MTKRGEKMTAKGWAKKVTDQISMAVKSNQDFMAASEKHLEELNAAEVVARYRSH